MVSTAFNDAELDISRRVPSRGVIFRVSGLGFSICLSYVIVSGAHPPEVAAGILVEVVERVHHHHDSLHNLRVRALSDCVVWALHSRGPLADGLSAR